MRRDFLGLVLFGLVAFVAGAAGYQAGGLNSARLPHSPPAPGGYRRPPSPRPPLRSASIPTILVAEDELQIASLVRDYLEDAGFTVLAADDGRPALAGARERRPGAIVLDLGLPGMDGLDVIRALRREVPTEILVLSARGDEADRVARSELGGLCARMRLSA